MPAATGATHETAFDATGRSGFRPARSLWRGAHLLVARGAVMSGTQLWAYDTSKRAALARGLLDLSLIHI